MTLSDLLLCGSFPTETYLTGMFVLKAVRQLIITAPIFPKTERKNIDPTGVFQKYKKKKKTISGL